MNGNGGQVKKILKHLGFWEINQLYFWPSKGQTATQSQGVAKIQEYKIDYSTSQVPVSDKCPYVEPEIFRVLPHQILHQGPSSYRTISRTLREGEFSGEVFSFSTRLAHLQRINSPSATFPHVDTFPLALFLAYKGQPPHHGLPFLLTHKEEFPVHRSPKRAFLSVPILK